MNSSSMQSEETLNGGQGSEQKIDQIDILQHIDEVMEEEGE